MVAMAGVIYAFMTVWFMRVNRSRDQGKLDSKVAGMSEDEVAEMGEHNPRYRYTY